MFTIISRHRETSEMQVELLLGTASLREANISLKRFEEAHPDKEVFLHLSSRSDESGNRYFPTTDDGNEYRFNS